MTWQLLTADCIEAMRELGEASVDAVVTDPPYGLEFMGKEWDSFTPGDVAMRRQARDMRSFGEWSQTWAAEALRVLKPGGHLLSFGGTRTYHRLACALEDAGFEIRDCLAWLYGSGFPKSLDVSKAIDKAREGRHAEAVTVTRQIEAAMRAKGLTRRDINREILGVDWHGGSAQSWTTLTSDGAHKPRVPEWDYWLRLRDLLGLPDSLDAEVWRLNGRKGTPGEAFRNREVVGVSPHSADRETNIGYGSGIGPEGERFVTAPATPDAERWQGWGTALKPAFEPIVLARKPLSGTVAANVLEHGTGALNVDGTRINPGDPVQGGGGWAAHQVEQTDAWDRPYVNGVDPTKPHTSGRWPANVLLDAASADTIGPEARFFKVVTPDRENEPCDPAATAAPSSSLPEPADATAPSGAATSPSPEATSEASSPAPFTTGTASGSRPSTGSGTPPTRSTGGRSSPGPQPDGTDESADPASNAEQLGLIDTTTTTTSRSRSAGSADPATSNITPPSVVPGVAVSPSDLRRAWYTAKTSRAERENGVAQYGESPPVEWWGPSHQGTRPGRPNPTATSGVGSTLPSRNHHPTVKPVDLMQWLVRLVTPPGGLILDPFTGSGSTGIAALREGFSFIGIEREADYVEIARARIIGDAPLFNSVEGMKLSMKKADKQWRDLVKERDEWMCRWHPTIPHHAEPRGLHAHHIFTRSRRPTRYMLLNGITLCYAHHMLAHSSPLEFQEMMRDRLGADEYDELRALSLRTKVSA